jgi:drug/metabolite transporter (DMT)-like permease
MVRPMGTILALASAMVYGIADYCGGRATRRASAFAVTLLGQAVSLMLLVVVVPLLGDAVPGWHDWAWGAAAGFFGALGLIGFYHALAHGTMTIVAPTTAVVSAVLPVVVGFAQGERPGLVATLGIVVACFAIALVSGASADPDHVMPRGMLLLAVVSGIGFGMIFIALAKTSAHSGIWPLIPARLISIPTVLLIATVARQPVRVPRPVVLITVVSGVSDMSANALYIVAKRHGLLTIVAVLSALYPVSTVILAAGIDKERVTRTQVVGLLLAVLALVLVARGSS